ncbi:MAG TPA: type II secretion system protein [Syntrophales bacterium]|nr:type II secretion system protein [Syntrophales bacterium]HOX94905.1 type II secretion system protein [Syntrophales bacterium]HPI56381.1 type II secretion system protein [Syntrophales bacterium]HPN24231.1 type II secretion system protein [Syntrophales bacterium]HQM28584.1 type II secretion system protein [Syntrophales bacterium]
MIAQWKGEKRQGGFTLIEVIVTIIVASIMGVLLVQFMGTAMFRSGEPLVRVQDVSTLRNVLENMTSDYKYLAATRADFLSTFKDRVDTGYYGTGYTATTKYIEFPTGGGTEIEDFSDPKLLKVTVTKGNQSITTIFAR